MNDTSVHSTAPHVSAGTRPSLLKVIRDQRKTLWVALAMMVGALWLGQLDRWTLAGCVAVGVFLGLCNHLATEYWLLKLISSGEKPTRNKMIASTIVRLVVLTVVAVAIAVMFWPDGIGLLLGLAIFRLIALMMTSITLLKELKES